MTRSIRHSKILEIINNKEIETQDELCDELNKLNFSVTQATVSRDIKELKLFKVAGNVKKYKYATIDYSDNTLSQKIRNLFKECVIAVNRANNLVLIKTLSGNGSNAGMIIDKLKMPEMLGSIAGDDTLLIVSDTNENAQKIIEKINDFIR
jgi:transcriptional regulator of arginine metabolism